MAHSEADIEYMRRAIELARRGTGFTNPNPLVGAVLVRDGEIIAEGWHARCGDLHAERAALANCRARNISPEGATLYVTLEPCCHTGKQPPCTEAVIESGIARVVVGSADPNPLVAGRGCEQLRAAGVTVDEGVAQAECDAINPIFFHFITHRAPYVTLKYAMTLDGKIATKTGASRWITGPAARERVHAERLRHAAIMVGIGTVLADDPQLTCRIEGGRNPLRVICDSHLRTPITSAIAQSARNVPTIIACAPNASGERASKLEETGCEIVRTPEHDGRIDLRQLMAALGKRGIDSVLIEGGATLAACALEAGIVKHVQAFIAPKIFAGVGAPSPLGGTGVNTPYQAWTLSATTVERLGDDVLIEGDVVAAENATPEHATTAHDGEIANAAPKEDACSQD